MGSESRERKHKKDKKSKKEKSSKRDRSRSRDRKHKKKNSNRSRSRSQDRYKNSRYDEDQKSDQQQQQNQLSKKFVIGEETEQERQRQLELQKKYGIQPKKEHKPAIQQYTEGKMPTLIEVIVNNRLGQKERIKCRSDDTIGNIKKLVAAKTGTRPDKIRLQKWNVIYKDHITLEDYEIKNGFNIEMYNN